MGSEKVASAHWKLKPDETFSTTVPAEGEQMLFVWRGSISVRSGDRLFKAGEKDTVFVSGPASLDVHNDSPEETVVIQVQSPPHDLGN